MMPTSMSILVVDDEPVIGSTIRQVLEKAGHHVVYILDGQTALARVRGDDRFDIVITDMFMPEVDGFQLIKAVKQHSPATRAIAMSGGGTYMNAGEVTAMARRVGANAVLEKPFTPQDLMDCVKRVQAE